jgi:hypothetical protein
MLRKQNCLHFSPKSPDCLPDGSDRTLVIEHWLLLLLSSIYIYELKKTVKNLITIVVLAKYLNSVCTEYGVA